MQNYSSNVNFLFHDLSIMNRVLLPIIVVHNVCDYIDLCVKRRLIISRF